MKTPLNLITLLLLCGTLYADIIPGIAPVDVYLNLERKGFTVDKRFAVEGSSFICTHETAGGHWSGQVHCPKGEITKAYVIVGMVQNYSANAADTDALSVAFLAYLASLPYAGSAPAEAVAWVRENIGKQAEKMFGPVKLQLFSQARTRLLRMSTEALLPAASTGNLGTAPAIKRLEQPRQRDEALRLPRVGTVYADVVSEHGKPRIQDADTGWAIWTSFKAKFVDGLTVEVAR